MGREGATFYGLPSLDDHLKLKLYEAVYWVGSISVIISIMVGFILALVYIDEGHSLIESIMLGIGTIGFFFCNDLLILTGLILIGLVSRLTMRRRWDRDPPIHTRVFEDHIEISKWVWEGQRLINRIPLSIIKDTKGSVKDHIENKGVNLPLTYRPFRQTAPDPKKSHTFLYYKPAKSTIPLDQLVRIDLSVVVPITYVASGRFVNDPDSKGFFSSMKYVTRKEEFRTSTILIPIRPERQREFHELIRTKREKAKRFEKPSVLEPPPK